MAPYTKKFSRNSGRKPIILSVLITLLIVGALAAVLVSQDIITFSNSKTDTANVQDGINFGPPTDQEKEAADDKAADPTVAPVVIDQKPGQETTNNKRTDVAVVISDATQYGAEIEVRAFMPDYLQNGTCTFTFTLGATTVVKQTTATADASSTICGNLVVPRSEFPQAGSWALDVNYNTEDVDSSSNTKQVAIS